MKITNEAKNLLQEVFTSNNADCLKAIVQKSCCGTSTTFTLAKINESDSPVVVNDIPILIGSITEEQLDGITIELSNGELTISDEKSSGCC